jgi:prepilin-type N-terminal cleavage/methylation domain-containing protein
MKIQSILNQKGVTLIELLVALVIAGLIIGGVYRVFVAQNRAYTVQDQVVEVQQGIRGAMETLLRDLRMTGFDDAQTPDVKITNPVVPGDHSLTVRYERDGTQREVSYWIDETSRLMRQETQNGTSTTEPLLENVDALNFSYGIDDDGFGNQDKAVDTWENSAANATGKKVLAVRVDLTARAVQVNQDLQNVSPRTLNSTVTFRNLTFRPL